MQHPDEGMIHAWIDGALDTETARDLETHLASCAECARMAAEARGLVAASSRILTALDNVPAKVIPVTGAGVKSATPVTRRWQTPFWMRTAAAVVIVAGASALVLTPKVNTPESKIDLRAPVAMEAVAMDSAVAASASTDLAAVPPSKVASQGTTEAKFSAKGPSMATPKAGRPGSRTESNTEPAVRVADELKKLRTEEEQERVADAARDKDEVRVGAATGAGASALLRDSSRRAADVVASSPRPAPQSAANAPPPVTDKRAESLRQSAEPVRIQPGISGTLSRRAPTAPSAEAVPGRISGDHPAVGCYALALSPWSGGTIPFGAPPARIELDSLTSLQDPIRGLNLVHPGPGAASNKAPLAYWGVLGDSVYVTWRDAQRGVVLKLPFGAEVMTGSARTFVNSVASAPSQSSIVEARRISCRP